MPHRDDVHGCLHRAYTGDGPLAKQSGALTQTLFDMLGEGLEGAKVGKMESLRDDLLRMIAECTAVPPEMARAIQQVTPKNTSKQTRKKKTYILLKNTQNINREIKRA